MIKFLENIGDFYTPGFFSDGFPKKVFDKAGYVTQKKDDDGKTDIPNHVTEINARVTPLREQYYQYKKEMLNLLREKDRVKRTHEFHKRILNVLGYSNGQEDYGQLVYLNDKEIIPVLLRYHKGNKPYLYIMEMKAMIKESDDRELEGIYEQTWKKDDWEKVYPEDWKEIELKPDVVKDALSELFLLPENERPVYVIVLAGAKIFLINYEKWKYDSYLLIDVEQLVEESRIPANRDYLSLFYALLNKSHFISETDSLLQSLDEDAHKAAYDVTQDLKKAVVYAVESLANEAIYYKMAQVQTPQQKEELKKNMASETFANELKDDCLTMVYRLLFLFYAESREELEILPIKDHTYLKGYSLEMLRDLEQIELRTESSRNGHFISHSLWKLFGFLYEGKNTSDKGFSMKRLDSPLFDNGQLKHLKGVQFRNFLLQSIILRLSLSKGDRRRRPGRISYANLGINQLGSVYESLLAYRGFFAAEQMIEVKAAKDKDGTKGTFVVPFSRRDDFTDDEVLKDLDNSEYEKIIPEGHFVYRLNGRDRKKTASYYTPEVLTRTTVKYTLKGILDRLKERQEQGEFCADEILNLKILEPAMGAAAFQNEAINQLAVAYLELKETEEVKKGRKRIVPGQYHDELQRVKAYIAANNVYGVDINPTAIELGKLSLWLNCMHKGMETPFFAHRLGVGNAVVGCWLKAYDKQEVIEEFPKEGTKRQRSTPIAKSWWEKAPQKFGWDKKGNLTRKAGQYYHFLLPDDNMLASAKIKLLKEELTKEQKTKVNQWKKEIKRPLSLLECRRLEKISKVIDALIQEHYKQLKGIIKDTTSAYAIYGQEPPQITFKGYDEKERLKESLETRNAPYYKLRMVMDYWCSLWFWDARNVVNLPNRTQWYNEVENILGVDLGGLDENASQHDILTNIKNKAADTWTLFRNDSRIEMVENLRNQHRFFHHELEFLEVFKEKGGFDVIVGNPPWVNIEFDELGIISEKQPELALREYSATRVNQLTLEMLKVDVNLFNVYIIEYVTTTSLKAYLGSVQNYPLLTGQRNNLYKCVLCNSLDILSLNGFLGLLHPEGIYDDPKGYQLREKVYQQLIFHFQFQNEYKLFKEIGNREIFSINVYRGIEKDVSFFSIHNLFIPTTIDLCFNSTEIGICGGIKAFNGDDFTWNVNGHPNRLIWFKKDELSILSKTFEKNDNYLNTKLFNIHSSDLLMIFKKLGKYKGKISDYPIKVTDCWNEHIAQSQGVIKRETSFSNIDDYELILSGPHFYVANPLYQTPKAICNTHKAYEIISLLEIEEDFIPRTNYKPNIEIESFKKIIKGSNPDKFWIDEYKLCFSRRLSIPGERTLQPSIFPPKSSHIHPVLSLVADQHENLAEISSLASSIVYDFMIKTIARDDLYESILRDLPANISSRFKNSLIIRILMLNCLNKYYSNLWNSCWKNRFNKQKWSKNDPRLKDFNSLTSEWRWETPLRNYYERRQALIEIDVITSMALGLSLKELCLIYNIQFPVLQQNENDTWYDQKGNIIFTVSKGLTGVGLDRNKWESVRYKKEGDFVKHVITKSELYNGKEVIYYPPFERFDRIEDYKTAWAHFEKVFAEEKQEK